MIDHIRYWIQTKEINVNDIKSHPFFRIIDWNKIYNKQYTNTPKHSPIYASTAYPTHLNVNNSNEFLYDF